ncbi:hypothetical protein DTO021D3_5064 [Paecilomyces variotii]|nr:hypothetical protein DTO032I3_6828 [Paecilomyces variotii]KAJ9278097.1 hypothetical protein DTO021D3_5064 [Paecilomyces variotii]KAJ9345814.1 hypothetical protein DTO027B6_1774 [Paecilomyces variotii]KAJ9387338.1 hypothetical protein DTO032I4_3202 [Paecilomyces variotii]KAJ9411570.1 hypothetical protein DTO045G8_477 [Paecilomyces variotii]
MESIHAIANPAAAAPGGGDGGRGGGDRGRGGRGGHKKAKRNRNRCSWCKKRGHGHWECQVYLGLRMLMNRGRGRGRGHGSAQRGRGRGGLLARGGYQGQLPGGQNQPLSAEANAGQIEAPAPQPEQAQDPVADMMAAISTLSEEERVRFITQALAATNQPLPGQDEEPKDGLK